MDFNIPTKQLDSFTSPVSSASLPFAEAADSLSELEQDKKLRLFSRDGRRL
jgi:hypothetical protein